MKWRSQSSQAEVSPSATNVTGADISGEKPLQTIRNVPSQEHGKVHKEEAYSPELVDALAQQGTGILTSGNLKLLPILIIGFLSKFSLYPKFSRLDFAK